MHLQAETMKILKTLVYVVFLQTHTHTPYSFLVFTTNGEIIRSFTQCSKTDKEVDQQVEATNTNRARKHEKMVAICISVCIFTMS